MKGKRNKSIVAVLATLLVAFLALYLTRPKEPSYGGKTLTQWLNIYTAEARAAQVAGRFESNIPDTAESVKAIRAIGTNGIPTLFSLLNTPSTPRAYKINRLLSRVPWITFRITIANDKWQLGLNGFTLLGHRAASAEHELIKMIEASHGGNYTYAFLSLCEVSSNRATVLPILIQAFHDTNVTASASAGLSLHRHYPEEAQKVGVYAKFTGFRDYPSLKATTTNAPSIKK